MKGVLRNIGIYAFSLFFLAQVFSGVKIGGSITTYIIGGAVLSIMFVIIKPIINIVTLPLNFVTLGMFSFLINAVILYFLTVLVPSISIKAFVFEGFSLAGFVIPSITLNTFFAFVVTSLFLSISVGVLTWLIKK